MPLLLQRFRGAANAWRLPVCSASGIAPVHRRLRFSAARDLCAALPGYRQRHECGGKLELKPGSTLRLQSGEYSDKRGQYSDKRRQYSGVLTARGQSRKQSRSPVAAPSFGYRKNYGTLPDVAGWLTGSGACRGVGWGFSFPVMNILHATSTKRARLLALR